MNYKHTEKTSQVKNIYIPLFLLKKRKSYSLTMLDCYVYGLLYRFGLVRLATGDESRLRYKVKMTMSTASKTFGVEARSIYRSIARLQASNLVGQYAETYRRGKFLNIPKPVINHIRDFELTLSEALVLSFIIFKTRGKDGLCSMSYAAIGECIGLSKHTVKQYCISLERRGYSQRSFVMKTSKKGTSYISATRHTPTAKVVSQSTVPALQREFEDFADALHTRFIQGRAPPGALIPAQT